MFEQSLFDATRERQPVLRTIHWVVAAGSGVVGFLLWCLVFSLFFRPAATHSGMVTQSIVFGFADWFVTAVILCYVYIDSKRWGFETIPWLIATTVFSLAGFAVYMFYSAKKTKQYARGSVPLAFMLEAIALGVAILIPLIKTQALPAAEIATFLAAPSPPPAAPPARKVPRVVYHPVSLADLMRTPVVIPRKIARIHDRLMPHSVGVVGVFEGVPGGGTNGAMSEMLRSLASSPPPPPRPKPLTQVVRLGGNIEQARLIYGPKPSYPPIAKMARIQGGVVLQALIAKDGTVKDLNLVSGSPMLAQAAISAVRHWRYEPTLLDGVPVEVETEIDVQFTLSQ
jgi:periplasmic protein TonB